MHSRRAFLALCAVGALCGEQPSGEDAGIRQAAAELKPATVMFHALPAGNRVEKFKALKELHVNGPGWTECPSEWRAPFLPASAGVWSKYPNLEDLFVYNGSGVQPKRTWVIAPDAQSLVQRWQKLTEAPPDKKEELFHATLRDGKPADRHIRSVVQLSIPGYKSNLKPLIDEAGPCLPPVQYGFRSFNRQWIIPDIRVVTQPNAELWESRSNRQVYLTALSRTSPSTGPAVTFTALVPDQDHYKGSFSGRVFPLWRDQKAAVPNIPPPLLGFLTRKYGNKVSAEDFMAYVAATMAHPAFAERFRDDLSTPGGK